MRSRAARLVVVAAAFWMCGVAGWSGWPVERSVHAAVLAADSSSAEPSATAGGAPTGGIDKEIPAPPTARRDATGDVVGPRASVAAESPADALPPRQPPPGRLVRVERFDGRSFDGMIDPRSDGRELWLCRRYGTAVVRRPIAWSLIAHVELAGQSVSGDELRAAVEQVRAESPRGEPAAPWEKTVSMRLLAAPAATAGIEPSEAPAPGPPDAPRHDGLRTGQVEWLAVEATAANWDGDVESDGLLLVVEPRDAAGRLVPVRGRLEVELIGRRWGVARGPQPYGRMAHWSLPVEPSDFGPLGARYRLAFQGVHPEFDPQVAPHGAIHARLSVPGRGVFEASDAAVRLRPYSAVRDEQQQLTGRRFFPGEQVSGPGR